jgi:lipopolysaccharide heptosyltransferase II/tetraacyldisaccharide 4'-kinase
MREYWLRLFRALTEEEGASPAAPPLKALARALAPLYGLGARGRRALYEAGLLRVHRLPAPVISVGNLTAGGTGKTPLVIFLARQLKEQGRRPAILSRGYGGLRRGVTRVSDGRQIYAKPPEVGDESYLLARSLPGVPVYTGSDRYAAGLAAWQDLRPDLFLLDDGFQHFRLYRDLDLVLLDAAAPFGSGRLLPAGPLREPPAVLAAAQVLILTRFEPGHQANLRALRERFPGQAVLTAALRPCAAKRFPGGDPGPPEALRGQRLLAFAGLARPEVFAQTLKDLGVDLAGFGRFPDHYPYRDQDRQDLLQGAAASGAAALVTTAKDWARLGEDWTGPLPLWVLEVEAHLEDAAVLMGFVEFLREGARGHRPAYNPPSNSLPQPLKGGGERDWGRAGEPCSPGPPPIQPLPEAVWRRFQGLRVTGSLPENPAAVRSILVRAPNWLGDAVMGLPVLAGLRSRFPEAGLTVLAAPRVAPLFWGQPGVKETLAYPPGPEKWRFLLSLRGQFDLALVLPNSLESALGPWLARVPGRVGYAANGRGAFLTVALSGRQRLNGLHTVYYLLGLLRAFGEVTEYTVPALVLSAVEAKAAAWLLGESAGPGGPWVGLSPGAAYGPAKRWPPERFAALGGGLVQDLGARLVLLGGPEDRPVADQVREYLQVPALDLVGRIHLRQALGVVSRLRLLVTNDSGLMHAATALGVPLVAIFGSTDPRATGPFTSRATVLYHPRPCSPCLKRTCDQDYACLTEISVAEALAAARAWLGPET